MKSKRLPKRPPNGNRPSKIKRTLNRMRAVASRNLNPLRWGGLVPKSMALRSHCGSNNWWEV